MAGKGESNEGKGMQNPKDNPKVPKVPKVRTMPRVRTLVDVVLKTRNQRQVKKHRDLHRCIPLTISGLMDGWSLDEWSDDWSSVGCHEGWDQTSENSASWFSLGSFDLGVTRSPKRFACVKMNLDTGAAVNTCSLNFWSRWSSRRKILQSDQW